MAPAEPPGGRGQVLGGAQPPCSGSICALLMHPLAQRFLDARSSPTGVAALSYSLGEKHEGAATSGM